MEAALISRSLVSLVLFVPYAESRLPSLTSFCIVCQSGIANGSGLTKRTRAFMVPCRACLWFLLNLGSVPLSEGYLCVLGFLILFAIPSVAAHRIAPELGFDEMTVCVRRHVAACSGSGYVPVPVVLLRLIMLRGVLGLCTLLARSTHEDSRTATYWPWRRMCVSNWLSGLTMGCGGVATGHFAKAPWARLTKRALVLLRSSTTSADAPSTGKRLRSFRYDHLGAFVFMKLS